MKKILFPTLGLVLMSQSFAQITLTEYTSLPEGGDIPLYSHVNIQAADIQESSTGANQTWDFSNFTPNTNSEVEFQFSDASSSSYASLFPTSNLYVFNPASPNYESFILADQDGYRLTGTTTYDQSTTLTITEGWHILKFPMTYNTTYTDSLNGHVSGNSTLSYTRRGNTIMTADGYGSLVLPYGTVDNVLRVKIERTYADYTISTSIPSIEYTEISHYYYSEENRHFIALTNELTVSGFTVQSVLQYQTEATLTTLGTNDFIPNQELSLYPNPAINQFTVKNIEENSTIEIVDINGRIVKTITQNTNNAIDITELTSGYYMVQINGNHGKTVKKLVIK